MSNTTTKARRLKIDMKAVKDLERALAAAQFKNLSKELQPHANELDLYIRTWVVGPLASALKRIRRDYDKDQS